MHASVMAFCERVITPADVAGQRVIEAGSANVNGSVRAHVMGQGPASYTGIDIQDGTGVDVVMDAADLPGGLGLAGLVVSTSALEHCEDWQAALGGMIAAVAPGGALVLTCPSDGFPHHDHPGDHWRFSVEAMRGIIDGAALDVVELAADPESPGILLKARKPAGWSRPPGMAAAWAAAPVTLAPPP